MNALQRMFGTVETPTELDLHPAYGKVYETHDAIRKAWFDGKDFGVLGGAPYMSARDTGRLIECGVTKVVLWNGPRSSVEVVLKLPT